MDERVVIVYQIMGGLFASLYFLQIFLPFVISVPFRPHLTLLFHRLSIAIVETVGVNQHWYILARTIFPTKYQDLRVRWENAFDNSLDNIDISYRVQEEAILWLSQMPLSSPESKPVVSSLAMISSSRPCRFPPNVIVFLNATLEAFFCEEPSQEQSDTVIDCVLAFCHIKFQSG